MTRSKISLINITVYAGNVYLNKLDFCLAVHHQGR